jgi:cell division protein ZapA
MGEVSVTIQGKPYAIACDDGQEKRVAALGRYVDGRLRDIGKSGAATGDSHLLVLTALMLADEVHDLHASLESVPAAPQVVQVEGPQRVSEDDERQIVEAINHLAGRIDSVAARLQKIQ